VVVDRVGSRVTRGAAGLFAVPVGLLADRAFGEPPTAAHPVAAVGRLMTVVERRSYADRRSAGVAHVLIGIAAAVLPAAALARVFTRPIVLGGATYVAVASRSLGEAATSVGDALRHDDLALARARLPALVGRDPAALDETEVARAVVESVAENTVDAVVAPVLWAVVAGPLGVLGYRAVNTLDAMVGHRSPRYERFGWAAARLDDVANWLPARVCALLVVAVRPAAARQVWRAARRDAPAHPSPNAGVAEAAFAAALGVRLGGVNRYGGRAEDRGPLGCGKPPEPVDIARAVALSRHVTLALAVAVTAARLWVWAARPARATATERS
jgi:adenosylcobinamide-phosphate synthase